MSDETPKDPFSAFESDRTVIKPSAGRGARAAAPAPAPAAPGMAGGHQPAQPSTPRGAAPAAPFDHAGPELPPQASLNPLVQAAAPLLLAAARLRAMVRHPNPAALRASLADSVMRFEAAARGQGLPNDQVIAARYVLCTLIDESASSTPWGGSGAWSAQSLLVQFHNEGWGGEKVFQLLTRLAQAPEQHRHLLELIWVVLSFGFEGRYRVADNGRDQLVSLRERLAQMLRKLAGAADRTLSPQWQGQVAPPQRLRDGVPLWVIASAVALLLVLVFVALRLSINVRTDATFAALQAIDARAAVAPPPAPPAVPTPPAAPPAPRLAQLLQADVAAGSLQVQDLADRSIVTLRGDALFDPGSAEPVAKARPLFERIAAALNQLPGQVLVSGHSDNQPIRSLRYPSNWHLSKDRADNVLRQLASTLPPARLGSESRADAEPVADNSSAEGRARNRRVEITLFAGATPG
jgi:type VI secretion system protein ImpK